MTGVPASTDAELGHAAQLSRCPVFDYDSHWLPIRTARTRAPWRGKNKRARQIRRTKVRSRQPRQAGWPSGAGRTFPPRVSGRTDIAPLTLESVHMVSHEHSAGDPASGAREYADDGNEDQRAFHGPRR